MTKITGTVIHGKKKGKALGFPTANIRLKENVKSGVYAGNIFLNREKYKAAIFISKEGSVLEAHLLNFTGNLYGKEMKVEMGPRLREVKNFKKEEDLINQIVQDVDLAGRT